MIDKLPLDSPLWAGLSACYSAENAIARLREVVASRHLGEAWSELRDEILHQGSVYGVSSAAIPHLVDVAPHLTAEARREVWIELGFLVTAGADRFPSPPEPGLQEGLTAALRAARTQAVRDFLADTGLTPDESGYHALACVALAGHRVGGAMWEFPSSGSGYVRVVCPGCDAEYEMDGFGDPLALPCPPPVFSPGPGDTAPWHDVVAALERADRDLGPGWSGFVATARKVAAAGVPPQAPSPAVWCLVAAMVALKSPEAARWARTLARLAGHVRCTECGKVWAIADVIGVEADTDAEPVPVTVEESRDALFPVDGAEGGGSGGGVPSGPVAGGLSGFGPGVAGSRDALFSVDGAEGQGSGGGVPTGAEGLSGFGPGVDGSRDALFPVDGAEGGGSGGGVPSATVADGLTGFRPAPGRRPAAVAVAARTLWRAGIGAVDALALVAGRSPVVAAAGGDATTTWDLASGEPAGPPLTGAAGAVASVALPDGRAVVATAGDGTVRMWEAASGRPLGGPASAGTARVVSLVPVLMPPGPDPRTVDWLAGLRTGQSLLAAGDADGAVRLWDPRTGAPLAELFRRAGRPVVSMTPVDFVDQPPWSGTNLLTVYDGLTVDSWASASVHGKPTPVALDPRKLTAIGHERLVGVAVSPRRLGYRRPVLLADHNGTVSMWETVGVRLHDPLPSDPAHDDVVGIAALPGPGPGPGDDITVVTASRANPGLRVWRPLHGSVTLVPLDVRPRCLANAGDIVLVGHDDGLLALSLADVPA